MCSLEEMGAPKNYAGKQVIFGKREWATEEAGEASKDPPACNVDARARC